MALSRNSTVQHFPGVWTSPSVLTNEVTDCQSHFTGDTFPYLGPFLCVWQNSATQLSNTESQTNPEVERIRFQQRNNTGAMKSNAGWEVMTKQNEHPLHTNDNMFSVLYQYPQLSFQNQIDRLLQIIRTQRKPRSIYLYLSSHMSSCPYWQLMTQRVHKCVPKAESKALFL